MNKADSHIMEFSLESIWRALSNRAAVFVGAATALCALAFGAPVRIASLRGAVAWAGILVITRMFGYAFRETASEQLEVEEPSPATPK